MPSHQADINLCRKEHAKQRRLEEFISKRQLKRPRIKKWHLSLLLFVALLLLLGAIICSINFPLTTLQKTLACTFSLLTVFEFYIRFCLVQAVKCYQHYAKEETRRRCMCVPSCSEYAILSLKALCPLIVVLFKIRKRLYRTCRGELYQLDYPSVRMNARFEKEYLEKDTL